MLRVNTERRFYPDLKIGVCAVERINLSFGSVWYFHIFFCRDSHLPRKVIQKDRAISFRSSQKLIFLT